MAPLWLLLPLFLVACQPQLPAAGTASAIRGAQPHLAPPPVASAQASESQGERTAETTGLLTIDTETRGFQRGGERLETALAPGYPLTFLGKRWLGGEFAEQRGRLQVRAVHRDSPLGKSGARAGDILVRLGGQSPSRFVELDQLVRRLPLGEPVPLVLLRGSQTRLFSLVLEDKPSPDALLRRLFVGEKAPALHGLETLSGASVRSLSDLRGKVVVLEFWATWCVACRPMTTTFNRWSSALKVYGVEFLGITEEPYDVASVGFEQLGYEYRGYVDPEGRVGVAYRATGLPTVFVLDKNGMVVHAFQGYSPDKMVRLRETLKGLVGGAVFESL